MSGPNGKYVSPWMDEDLQIFREATRRFIETEIAPHEEKWREQHHSDRDAWLKAGEMGLLLTDIPREYGGAGGHFGYEAVVMEELAYAGVSSFGTTVHSIAAHYILNYATEEQKQKWLPKMASGELIGSIGMSEPGAGSDLQGIKTRAVREGDHYVINGSKTFITNGYNTDLIALVTRTDPAAGSKGISLIMVEARESPGYRVGRILDKVGQRGQDTCELFFDDCRVPTANLLGPQEGQGFAQLMRDLPYERLMIAVVAVAAMERAVGITADYTKQRKAFGKALLEMQNTRFKLAEAKTVAHIARVFVDDCVVRLNRGELDTVTASMAKWWTTEMQCQVVDECVQLHGGYGYMLEYPIALMYGDARVQKIYGGANEIMKELIARSL